jgi:dienelactone hydrolase
MDPSDNKFDTASLIVSRLYCALLVLLLLGGCGDQAPQVPATPSTISVPRPPATTPLSLSEARKGFTTKLIRRESAGQPLPTPPRNLFRVVQFESAVGKLGAYLTLDPNDGKKHPAIIWITGGDCSTIDESLWQNSPPSNDQTARQFREAGIVMMFPTQRGGNQNPGFHEGFFGEVDDILSAAEFLATQDFVEPQRIYLGGHSSGATMVLLAAECSTRFRAVFSVGPTHDIRAYPPQFNALFQPFDTSNEREFELRAPGLWLHSIKVPVFVFAGTVRDGALPDVQTMTRTSTNPKVHYFTVAGANHFDILAPINRLVAEKILRDESADCNIVFATEELNKPFAK